MKRILLLITTVVFVINVNASHLTGMDLTYECVSGNQYKFILDLYRDCSGISAPTSNIINASSSCGNLSATLNEVDLSPNDPNSKGIYIPVLVSAGLSTCNGGSQIGVMHHRYEGLITLNSCSDWNVSWSSCCRNGAANNTSSGGMAIEVSLNNSSISCLNSPKFLNVPVFAICNNYPFVYSQGALDPDGDSLVFSLVDAFDSPGTTVTYNAPYTALNPISGVSNLNVSNGDFYINTSTPMISIVAIRVDEYRNGILLGSVMRDMQVIVDSTCISLPRPSGSTISSLSSNAVLNSSNEVTIKTGEQFDMSITVVDTSGDNSVVLSGFFNENKNGNWNLMDSSFFSMNNGSPLVANFSWSPTIADLGTHEVELEVYSSTAYPYWYSYTYPYTINVVENPNASINSDLVKDFKIYPNPTKGMITIMLTEQMDKANFTLIDIAGKVYVSKQLRTNISNLEFDIPNGIYFAKIETDNNSVVKKLIKE